VQVTLDACTTLILAAHRARHERGSPDKASWSICKSGAVCNPGPAGACALDMYRAVATASQRPLCALLCQPAQVCAPGERASVAPQLHGGQHWGASCSLVTLALRALVQARAPLHGCGLAGSGLCLPSRMVRTCTRSTVRLALHEYSTWSLRRTACLTRAQLPAQLCSVLLPCMNMATQVSTLEGGRLRCRGRARPRTTRSRPTWRWTSTR